MVSGRVHSVRHVIADHAVLHPFLVLLIEVLENNLTNGFDRLAPILGQFREVFVQPSSLCSAWRETLFELCVYKLVTKPTRQEAISVPQYSTGSPQPLQQGSRLISIPATDC